MNLDKYEYIVQEEESYRTNGVDLDDQWHWSMYDHIRRSYLVKNSKFFTGKNDGERPNKNIVLPILNVQYRTEGFDVKDIQPFVDEAEDFYKSFLVKKYHPRWARKYSIDEFIDEMVESYVDYGLALIKNVNNVRPEVVPLQRLAFCDQTDILSGAICEKHQYSVDQLMDQKWDKDKVQEAIDMAEAEKEIAKGKKTKTPSKYIEVYELHGSFPKSWLNEGDSDEEYSNQIHIVAYYKDSNEKKHGITLFQGKESKPRYKAYKRDDIFGRACGRGGIEELFEAQTWTNYSEIQIKELLDAASLLLLQSSDRELAERNKISDLEKGEILYHSAGEPMTQVTIQPQNKQQFDENVDRWNNTAQTIGSANEAVLGESPTSGTPFKLQNLVTQHGLGLHKYRQGKLSTFTVEIYRDCVLQYLVNDMNHGQKFLEELSLDELEWVADQVITNLSNDRLKELVFKEGKSVTEEERQMFKQVKKEQFMKGGTKQFLEIIKDELKDIPVDVVINIKGKQKDLQQMTDKLVNIFRQIVAAPQIMQVPGMPKLFNQIIESSGLDPVDFSSFTNPKIEQAQPQPAQATLETNNVV